MQTFAMLLMLSVAGSAFGGQPTSPLDWKVSLLTRDPVGTTAALDTRPSSWTAPLRRQTPEGTPVKVGGTIKAPAKVRNVPPVYPAEAAASKIQGRVVIEAILNASGAVSAAKVVGSLPALDQAAMDAVRQWVYEPTIVNGRAVPVIMTVTLNFALDPEPPPAQPLLPGSFDSLVAERKYAEAEALARDAPAHLALANALVDVGSLATGAERTRNLSQAEAHYYQAIELTGDSALRRAALLRLQGYFENYQVKRLGEFHTFLTRTAARYPTETAPHLISASRLNREKTIDAYLAAMRRARTRFPGDAEVRSLLAMALREKFRLSPKLSESTRRVMLAEAGNELDEALKLDSESGLALLNKALVLRDLAGIEQDPSRAAALEAEAQRFVDRENALAARKPK